MTSSTPQRFRNKDGKISSSPLNTMQSRSSTISTGNQKTISENLASFLHYDKYDIYGASRMLVKRSKSEEVWCETESYIRSIARNTLDVSHPPLVFDYTLEESAYANHLMYLITKYQFLVKEPPMKVVQLPAISSSVTGKIAKMFSVENIYFSATNQFTVDSEYIKDFHTDKTDVKLAARQFMTHLLMKMTSPPELIKRFTVRTNRSHVNNGLESLPEGVINELIRITMDAFCLFRWELRDGIQEDQLIGSTWFNSLGKTLEERRYVRQRILDFKSLAKKTFRDLLQVVMPEIRRCTLKDDRLVRVNHEKKGSGEKRRVDAKSGQVKRPIVTEEDEDDVFADYSDTFDDNVNVLRENSVNSVDDSTKHVSAVNQVIYEDLKPMNFESIPSSSNCPPFNQY